METAARVDILFSNHQPDGSTAFPSSHGHAIAMDLQAKLDFEFFFMEINAALISTCIEVHKTPVDVQ
jgi:hypothetical protein